MARVLDRSSGRPSCAIGAGGARQAGSVRDASRAGHCPGRGCSRRPTPKTSPEVALRDGRRRSPKPRRPLPMKLAGRTRTAWSIYPTARQADGVLRFLIELRCEKLRPRLLSLAEQVDDKAPARRRGPGSQRPLKRPSRKGCFGAALAAAENARDRTSEENAHDPRFARRSAEDATRTRGPLPTCRSSFWLCSARGSRNSTAARRSHAGGGDRAAEETEASARRRLAAASLKARRGSGPRPSTGSRR